MKRGVSPVGSFYTSNLQCIGSNSLGFGKYFRQSKCWDNPYAHFVLDLSVLLLEYWYIMLCYA